MIILPKRWWIIIYNWIDNEHKIVYSGVNPYGGWEDYWECVQQCAYLSNFWQGLFEYRIEEGNALGIKGVDL